MGIFSRLKASDVEVSNITSQSYRLRAFDGKKLGGATDVEGGPPDLRGNKNFEYIGKEDGKEYYRPILRRR